MNANIPADNFFNPKRRWAYQKILLLALVLSIILNGGSLFMMRRTLTFAPVASQQPLISPYKEERKAWAFTLAETPESARRDKPPQQANHISDKNAVAQNPEAPQNLPAGEPFVNGASREADTGPSPELQSGKTPSSPSPETSDELMSSNVQAVRPTTGASSNFRREFLTGETATHSPSPYASRYQPGLKNSESRAPELGDFSLNTYAWNYAPYLLWLKRRVEPNVHPPPAYTRMGIISGRTVLRFQINRDGSLSNLRLVTYEGHKSLMETSMRAILVSAPFRALPKDFPEEYLEIVYTFIYNDLR